MDNGMVEVDFIGLTFEELNQLKPLLSQSSYENIKKEFKRLEKSPPPLKGSGVYNHQYDPVNEEEYKKQNQILKNRLQWQRTLFSLTGIQNDFLSKKNRKLSKENEQLRQENEQLHKEKERLKQQIRKILGVDKKKSKRGEAGAVDVDDYDYDEDGDYNDNTFAEDTSLKRDQDQEKKPKKRGAPEGHVGRTRPIPDKDEIDEVEIILPPLIDICPNCGESHPIIYTDTDTDTDTNFISKYIEDIRPVVKKVVEKRYVWGSCCNCHAPVIEPEALSGPPVTIGPNLITLLSIMRQQMGVTYRKLGQFSTETLCIALSPSGVLGILNRVCNKLEPIYKGIESSIPSQAVIHGDETGWKMDGENWQLWCFCNRFMVYYFPNKSRSSEIPKAILGVDYAGILHADFYGAYNFVAKIQRCLIHFLGDIRDELEISPDDEALNKLKAGIEKIIDEGTEIKQLPDGSEKKERRKEVESSLQKLTKLDSQNKKTKTLIKRIIKHQNNLLRFIDHPDVEYHNNRAERAIRPAVIFRKISFGNRTPQGAYNYAILASVLETCRLKSMNLKDFVQKVYNTPLGKVQDITRALLDTS
jgi:hypothetical protein